MALTTVFFCLFSYILNKNKIFIEKHFAVSINFTTFAH